MNLLTYRRNHAVVFFYRTTTSKESYDKNDNADGNQQIWYSDEILGQKFFISMINTLYCGSN